MTDPQNAESIKWLNHYSQKHRLPKDLPAVYQHLEQAINDYLHWMQPAGYSPHTRQNHQAQLNRFLLFVKNRRISWEIIFTTKNRERFKKITGQRFVPAINGLSRYLFSQGKIAQPLAPKAQPIDLPKIYEDYLSYQQTHRQASGRQIKRIKRVLAPFDDYLQTHQIALRVGEKINSHFSRTN